MENTEKSKILLASFPHLLPFSLHIQSNEGKDKPNIN